MLPDVVFLVNKDYHKWTANQQLRFADDVDLPQRRIHSSEQRQ